ncbi:basic proline-rich protein-like [Tachyglossus aculeatus]|uniref:basic proline-rich protein-like n=1 Tax=Tachyglossus aculeatus TaxID=9261 RepID=UPI0018F46670|nr:basic proline-rich protein-like [Tachyglossus aculeatus]
MATPPPPRRALPLAPGPTSTAPIGCALNGSHAPWMPSPVGSALASPPPPPASSDWLRAPPAPRRLAAPAEKGRGRTSGRRALSRSHAPWRPCPWLPAGHAPSSPPRSLIGSGPHQLRPLLRAHWPRPPGWGGAGRALNRSHAPWRPCPVCGHAPFRPSPPLRLFINNSGSPLATPPSSPPRPPIGSGPHQLRPRLRAHWPRPPGRGGAVLRDQRALNRSHAPWRPCPVCGHAPSRPSPPLQLFINNSGSPMATPPPPRRALPLAPGPTSTAPIGCALNGSHAPWMPSPVGSALASPPPPPASSDWLRAPPAPRRLAAPAEKGRGRTSGRRALSPRLPLRLFINNSGSPLATPPSSPPRSLIGSGPHQLRPLLRAHWPRPPGRGGAGRALNRSHAPWRPCPVCGHAPFRPSPPLRLFINNSGSPLATPPSPRRALPLAPGPHQLRADWLRPPGRGGAGLRDRRALNRSHAPWRPYPVCGHAPFRPSPPQRLFINNSGSPLATRPPPTALSDWVRAPPAPRRLAAPAEKGRGRPSGPSRFKWQPRPLEAITVCCHAPWRPCPVCGHTPFRPSPPLRDFINNSGSPMATPPPPSRALPLAPGPTSSAPIGCARREGAGPALRTAAL